MVETSDTRESDDFRTVRRTGIHGTGDRSVLKRSVDALVVVVVDVFTEQPPQVIFVQDNYVIEQFPAKAADKSLGRSVLPRASEGRPLWTCLEALDRARDCGREGRVVVVY